MKLSLTSWSFPSCTLPEVAAITKALGINALDVGYFYRSALDKQALLDRPEQAAKQVAALGVDVPCLYHLFGENPADRNLADRTSHAQNQADFAQVLAFCKAAGIPTVFILPGVVNPGQSRSQALEASAACLRELAQAGAEAGVAVSIEPHVHSFLESPGMTLELLERVPGLRLTLDYAHFVCLGYRQEEIDPLAAHAAHMHIRQARPGVLQAKATEGTINHSALLGTLRDCGYGGALAIEFVHQNYMGTLYDDVMTETVSMRDALRAWLS